MVVIGFMDNLNKPKSSLKILESGMLTEAYIREFRQRLAKDFLDIVVLRLIQAEPMWGYKIIKIIKKHFNIKLRHGALYPLLNSLEANGFLISKEEVHGRRMRKVYEVTPKGTQLIDSYQDFLREQLQMLNIRGQEI